MKLLGIETSTEACSAAVMVDDEIIEQFDLQPRRHNDLILPQCEQVLAKAGVSLNQLDAIAFGCGPGAFTGVRIGAAVTQGIAFAHDLPVIPVSTLANLAQQAFDLNDQYEYVMPAIDARMDEIYWAVYQKNNPCELTPVTPENVSRPENLDSIEYEVSHGMGSGWASYAEHLAAITHLNTESYDGTALPHAKVTLQLAKPKFMRKEYVDASQALPVYVRDNVAQKKSDYKESGQQKTS